MKSRLTNSILKYQKISLLKIQGFSKIKSKFLKIYCKFSKLKSKFSKLKSKFSKIKIKFAKINNTGATHNRQILKLFKWQSVLLTDDLINKFILSCFFFLFYLYIYSPGSQEGDGGANT